MKIYIVTGSTGEYSDRNDWNVIAYRIEQLAKRHVELASQSAAKIFASDNYGRLDNAENPYDPFMKMSYTGTFYGIDAVELTDVLPRQLEGEWA